MTKKLGRRELLYLLVLGAPVYLLPWAWKNLPTAWLGEVDGFAVLGALLLAAMAHMLLVPLVYAARHGFHWAFAGLCVLVLAPNPLLMAGVLLVLPVIGHTIGHGIHRFRSDPWRQAAKQDRRDSRRW